MFGGGHAAAGPQTELWQLGGLLGRRGGHAEHAALRLTRRSAGAGIAPLRDFRREWGLRVQYGAQYSGSNADVEDTGHAQRRPRVQRPAAYLGGGPNFTTPSSFGGLLGSAARSCVFLYAQVPCRTQSA